MYRNLIILLLPVLLFSCGGDTTKVSDREKDASKGASITDRATPPTETIEVDIEDTKRTEWQNPDLILDRIGDLENKSVADIGAGSGYFTFKIARRAAKVIALDIDPKALDYIESQKEIVGEWSNNIEVRLTPPDVPNLLEEEVDLVLIVNTYNYIPNKEV